MREAFSIITAVFVIIIMATVAGFIVSLSGKMVQGTTVQFQREQSMLLAKSYTEYAILAVTGNEHNSSNCLNSIHGDYGIYSIDVNISYIANTATTLDASCTNVLSSSVTTPKSPLNIIVDVDVSYPILDHPVDPAPRMHYRRRSLQKI